MFLAHLFLLWTLLVRFLVFFRASENVEFSDHDAAGWQGCSAEGAKLPSAKRNFIAMVCQGTDCLSITRHIKDKYVYCQPIVEHQLIITWRES
jgi:hypothetical protein